MAELDLGRVVGEKGDKGDTGATPNVTASASVDANTGTPAVTVTKTGTTENPNFAFAFQNLKGAQGETGQTGATGATGATPNITATASVDANTGTPSVTVTKSGTAESPTIDFAFKNLKGETGATPTMQNLTIGIGTTNVPYNGGTAKNVTFGRKRYTVATSAWSASANASGYYTASITTDNFDTSYTPTIMPTGSSDSVAQTAAQIAAYRCILPPNGYVWQNSETSFTFYAKTKPTTTFYVMVDGAYSS